MRRLWKTIAWRAAFCGVAGFGLLAWPPMAEILARPLTGRYAREAFPSGRAKAIVVLSGAVSRPAPQRPYPLAGRDTYRRVLHAAWLFHH
jgi:hypothetical protein